MNRPLTLAAGQLGPIQKAHSRKEVVARLIELMRQAKSLGADVIVYPELALTTFFPRWYMEDQAEIDGYFEAEMPGPETRALFDEAVRLEIGFALGYAELCRGKGVPDRHFNTMILVDKKGQVVHKYRKIHLPGHRENEPWRAFQHLEKRYFEVGDLGFTCARAFGGIMGMCLCNDRRWSETYRCLGLQGVEVIMLGYNTPVHNPPAPDHDAHSLFHNNLVMSAGAYQNGTFVVGVAKAGNEEGIPMIAGTQILAPSGQILAQCHTEDDEVCLARVDLDWCRSYKTTTFNFEVHRQPQAYGRIVEQKGVITPP